MENKKQSQTGVQAQAGQQKPGFGSNNQSQSGMRAPQGTQTTDAQKASQQKQNISGSQRDSSTSSRVDQDFAKDDSRQSSISKDRKI